MKLRYHEAFFDKFILLPFLLLCTLLIFSGGIASVQQHTGIKTKMVNPQKQ